MRCPVCNNDNTKVLDSRVTSDRVTVRRRRECLKCNFRFSTIEEIEILDIKIIKKDGSKQSYDKDKLRDGIKKSLEKRNKSDFKVSQLIRDIEVDIQKKRSNEIPSIEVGDIVMKHLKKFDKIAYIRYASVYRSFDDLETFEEELSGLIRKKRKK